MSRYDVWLDDGHSPEEWDQMMEEVRRERERERQKQLEETKKENPQPSDKQK